MLSNFWIKMNPNHIKTEKKIQNQNSDYKKKKSRTAGSPEGNYLTRCRAFSDLLVTSDENSAQEGFEYLYKNYKKSELFKPETTESKIRRQSTYGKYGFKI